MLLIHGLILRITYSSHISSTEVEAVSRCNIVSNIAMEHHLRFFGPLCTVLHAVAAAICKPSLTANDPGKSYYTWLRANK